MTIEFWSDDQYSSTTIKKEKVEIASVILQVKGLYLLFETHEKNWIKSIFFFFVKKWSVLCKLQVPFSYNSYVKSFVSTRKIKKYRNRGQS